MPSRQFSRASSAVEVEAAFIAASTARRSAAGNGNPSCASERQLRPQSSRRNRTTATSIPSAEVPLMMPATVIAFALMQVATSAVGCALRNRLAEAQNARAQRLKLFR